MVVKTVDKKQLALVMVGHSEYEDKLNKMLNNSMKRLTAGSGLFTAVDTNDTVLRNYKHGYFFPHLLLAGASIEAQEKHENYVNDAPFYLITIDEDKEDAFYKRLMKMLP